MKQVTTHRNRFLVNFIWLFSFTNLGYLFSIITIPVLISKFGYLEMGMVFTIQAIVLGMAAIANYSFTFYVPLQSKSISESDTLFKQQWSLTLTLRTYISVFLVFLSAIIVSVHFKNLLILWLLSLPIVLAKIINPNLFFNAIEKNKYVLLIGFFSKLLFLGFILLISKIAYVNLFFGLSEFIVILFFLYKSKLPFFKFQITPLHKVLMFVKETYYLFLVNFFSILKPVSILPLLTYLFGSASATTYTLADKVINIIRGVSGAMFTSFFPIYNKEKFSLQFFKQKIGWVMLFSGFVVFVLWIASPYLIYVLNDFQYNETATNVLRILSISIPMFFVIIPLFSYLLELKKWKVILNFAILQLVALYLFYAYLHTSIYQIAIGFVVSEYVMLWGYATYIYYLKKNDL